MTFDMKSYMVEWRQKNSDRLSETNRRWREANPQYAKAWRDKHPNYQKLYREKNPNHRKLWNIKFPNRSADAQSRAKLALTHVVKDRPYLSSCLKPISSEYSEYPLVAQQIINLCGCKYMINNEFCNSVKLEGKPYCLTHMSLCYLSGSHTDKLRKGLEQG